ncbi:hypothetical protein CERZMDRAFT_64117 [Cercospora zeae-maydis SCOH1-5]|uniref:Uncharacterized protein n=1 Tax=Cercospora zeae-maydis SCOH1-5 TaxID=717836 RepID=A0A6A6FXB5_9PEZI|nr:hypothetical protein CERZMDRAFT_64117 [Cercospora zeae-maydis SCOH1-5]
MATRIGDRSLWLGAGVFFYFAAKYIKHAVTDIVRLTELDPAQFPANDADHSTHPEESVEVRTLKTLCLSPNDSIAAAAHSLVIRRFAAQPNAINILRHDIDSKNPETSRRAKQAVQYLYEYDLELQEPLLHGRLDDLALPAEHATDEENRRRRHREAMVLHDGDGRIEEEDIIRPSPSRWT